MKRVTDRPCWEVSDAMYALPIDAGAMPDELFRVAHVPGVITRYRFRGHGSAPGEGHRCSENDVLDDLLEGEATMRVAAVVGEVGTGKSHLVRWLYIEFKRRLRQDAELRKRLHVVYVPKTKTTLKRVVERILVDQHGEQFDEFKQRLQRAQDNFNRETAMDRLIDEIANSIRDLRGERHGDVDPHREVLLKQLPVLLQDPVYRDVLSQRDGVIRRTIDVALERGGASAERPRFEEHDLHLDLADLGGMSAQAKKLFGKLTSNDRWTTPTLDLLNDVIDSAVGALFDVRRGEVGDLLIDVRAALEEQGRELVLLVEDLALLQGVEQELLEAVIAPVQEVEGRRLCPVRAAFAATTGHFEKMATVRSRLDADNGFLYSLDASLTPSDATAASLDDALNLVGSYLNAARLGKAEIETWARSHTDDDEQALNICAHHCDLAEHCLRGFGVSPRGHGLYPFNAAAIERTLLAEGTQNFEPRLLLKHVRDTLREERQAIAAGEFPTDRWARKHNPAITPIADRVVRELESAHRSEKAAQRAEYLLLFWGATYDSVVNLPADVHEAFKLPEVDGAPRIKPGEHGRRQEPPPRRREGPGPKPEPRREPFEQDLDRIAGWRTAVRSGTTEQRELPGPLARDLRQDLAEAILERLPAALDFLSFDKGAAASELSSHIYITGASAGNPRTEEATVMRLSIDDEPLFVALRKRRRRVELDDRDINAVLDACDQYAETVLAWLHDYLATGELQQRAAQLAYLAAAVSTPIGDPTEGLETDGEIISALFTGQPTQRIPPQLPRRQELGAALQGDDALGSALAVLKRSVTVRQSATDGGPQGVDATQVLKHVEAARAANLDFPQSRTRSGLPARLRRASELIPGAVSEAQELLDVACERLNELEADADTSSARDGLRSMVDATANANIRVGDLTQLRSVADRFARVDLQRLRNLLTRVAEQRTYDDALRFHACVPWDDIAATIAFVDAADAAIATAQREFGRGSGAVADAEDTLDETRARALECAEALSNLADALDEEVAYAS